MAPQGLWDRDAGWQSPRAPRVCHSRRRRRRSEEHTSELQSPCNLVCRLLLEKKKNIDSDIRILKFIIASIGEIAAFHEVKPEYVRSCRRTSPQIIADLPLSVTYVLEYTQLAL